MAATYRVTAPYVTLKIVDPVAGTPTMLGFYEGAHVAGDRVDKASLKRHLDRGWIEKFDQVPAEPAVEPAAGSGKRSDGHGPVPDGTAEEVLAWVGDNKERAAQALVAEQGRDKPRKTLVDQLTKLADLGAAGA